MKRSPLTQYILSHFTFKIVHTIIDSLSQAGFAVFLAFGLKNMMSAAQQGESDKLIQLLPLFASVFFGYNLLSRIYAYFTAVREEKSKIGLKKFFFERLFSNDYQTLHSNDAGEIHNRFRDDLEEVRNTLCVIIPATTVKIVLILVYSCLIWLWVGPVLLAAGLVLGALPLISNIIFIPSMTKLRGEEQKREDKVIGFVKSAVENVKAIKARRLHREILCIYTQRLREYNDTALLIEKTHTKKEIGDLTLGHISRFGLYAIVFLWAGISRNFDIGLITYYLLLASRLKNHMKELIDIRLPIKRYGISLERLQSIMVPFRQPNPPAVDDSAGVEKENFEILSLHDVSFIDGKKHVIDTISLNLQRGEKLLIRGPNGSGKSLLSKIMMGLIPPTRGGLLINGKPYKENAAALSCFSWVPQQEFFFPATAAENLGLFDVDVTHLPLFPLPGKGSETRVDKLSSGQKQKLNLLRGLGVGEVVVIDEPDSYLDEKSWKLFCDWLNRCNKTVVLISHRHEPVDGFRIIDLGENHA